MQHQQMYEVIQELYTALANGNIIVCSREMDGKANGMTIAWGFIGNMWNDPYFISAIRPYRYTWKCIRESERFTVNVLSESFSQGLQYFGTVSGFNEDKFGKGILHLDESLNNFCAPIQEAHIILDCTVVTANNMQPFILPAEIIHRHYEKDNGFHTMVYGRIDSLFRR